MKFFSSLSRQNVLISILTTLRRIVLASSLLLSLFFSNTSTAAPALNDDVKSKLQQAISLALHSEEQNALEIYLALLDEQYDGAQLRYNIGTLYLQDKKIAPAVFHLATALKYAPDDEDAAYNLNIALALREDRVAELGVQKNELSSWVAQLPQSFVLGMFLIFLILLLIIFSFWPILDDKQKIPFKKLSLGIALLSLPAASLLGLRIRTEAQTRALVWQTTTARVGPDASAKAAFEAHEGLLGTLKTQEGDFTRLRLDNGLDVWLQSAALKKLP